MSSVQPDPVLHAIAEAATRAAGASAARMVARWGGELRIVAAVGAAREPLGSTVGWDSETLGYVVASGQPVSLQEEGEPPVLCVPCTAPSGIIGALEVVGASAQAAFEVDAIETTTLLAGIAGAALAHAGWQGRQVMSPAEIGGELARLQSADPARYGTVAALVSALLANG